MHFIDDVILPAHKGKKIHIVGNSVGGYLSVFLATRRPDLVASLCLLNATPVRAPKRRHCHESSVSPTKLFTR